MKAAWLLVMFALCSAAIGVSPRFAAAKPSDQRALDLAYEGDELFAKGKWEEAFARFREADGLAHSPVFVLYMARAKRNAGSLLEATKLYEQVASERVAANAPKPFRVATEDAATELAEVRAKTPRVRVVVLDAPPGELEIRVDGSLIRADEVVTLDPGKRTFTAKAAGVEVEQVVQLSAGPEEVRVALSFAKGDSNKPSDPPPHKRGSLAPGIALLSLAVAGLELGAVSGGIAAKTSGDIKDNCVDGHCLRSDADALDRARLLANVSTGAFVAAGAFAVTGAVLLAVRPGGESAPSVGVSPGFISVHGSF